MCSQQTDVGRFTSPTGDPTISGKTWKEVKTNTTTIQYEFGARRTTQRRYVPHQKRRNGWVNAALKSSITTL